MGSGVGGWWWGLPVLCPSAEEAMGTASATVRRGAEHRPALGFVAAAPSCDHARESQSCCDAAYGAPWWCAGGGQEELGEGRSMHINHYWRTSQLLSQAVACRCSWCSPDINHNSPTIDPFAAAIRKSVLVLSIF